MIESALCKNEDGHARDVEKSGMGGDGVLRRGTADVLACLGDGEVREASRRRCAGEGAR